MLAEALYQLQRFAPEVAERIERWGDIIRFRHILVHGYDVLELTIMWHVIKLDLPPLIEQLLSMLTEEN